MHPKATLDRVSVLVLGPVSAFELGVAVEVFGVDRRADGVPPVDFRVCSPTPGVPLPVMHVPAVTVTATYGVDDVVGSRLVIVCATSIRPGSDYPAGMLTSLRTAYDEGAILLGLCSGAFALGAAGLLDGRRSTTHWLHTQELQEAFPLTDVRTTDLFVDEGPIVTSAGRAGAIDASLHLVRREWGASVASTIAQRMVVPPQRDGEQRQLVEAPIPSRSSESLSPLLTWVLTHLGEEHTTASLARRAVMSERTFLRRFLAETGTTPHRWVTRQRVLAAQRLLEESGLGLEQISSRVGFGSALVLRDNFRRVVGLRPSDYRRRFARPGVARCEGLVS